MIALAIILYFFVPRVPDTSQGGFVTNHDGQTKLDGSYTMSGTLFFLCCATQCFADAFHLGYIPINITSVNYYPIYVRLVTAIVIFFLPSTHLLRLKEISRHGRRERRNRTRSRMEHTVI